MSLPDPHSEKSAVQTTERRKYPRHKPRQLVYVDIGENNGGFILDVSEGGVCFQGVASLNDGEIVKIRFKLPGSSTSIRTEGQFIRAGSSEKGGALKFLNIPSEVQMQLREWIALSGRPQSPSGDTDVLALLSAAPKHADEGGPAGADGARRFTSILAQALAKSSLEAEPADIPPADAAATTTPTSTTRVPDARETIDRSKWGEPIPPSTLASGLPAANDSNPIRAEEPKHEENAVLDLKSPTLFGLAMNPSSRAANDSVRNVREAVLSSAKQRNKSLQVSHFTAGIVVGCVVLATVGGALVATGRLRLVQPSPTPAVSAAPVQPATAPAVSNVDSGAVDLGAQNAPSVAPPPSASDPAAAQTQSDAPLASVPGATQMTPEAPAAGAPIRNEKPTSAPQRPSVLHPTSYAEASRPSVESVRRAQSASSLPLDMSHPVAQPPSAPGRVDTQAPALSASVAPGLPQLGSDTPAAITQTSSPSASLDTFASPQMEQRPTPKAPRTDTVSQRSKPVFAAPDPSGAKPSGIEPAQLVLYVEPVYPAAARSAKIEGNVDILATIGKDGVPRSLQLANGDQQLAAAAIAAISGWRYRPAMLNGQFEESLITITVKFAL